jgi:hypothetical protein
VLGPVLAGFVLFACYLRQSRTAVVGPDGAARALQGWDLLHGNPLLHGWRVTDVSLYTTELPQYALVELARGLSADAVHVAGAMTYTLVVLAAALLAQGRSRGAAGVTRALLAAGIMLAPQLGPGTRTLLLSPGHVGTCVPILLVFLLIDRTLADSTGVDSTGVDSTGVDNTGVDSTGERSGWYVPVLVWLGLTWTALADPMTILVAIIPLTVVCVIRIWHGTLFTKPVLTKPVLTKPVLTKPVPGPHREPFAAYRREASLALVAVLAVQAELTAAALIGAHGGWRAGGPHVALGAGGQLIWNILLTGRGLLELFGADVFGAATGMGTFLAAAHLLGLALAVAGVLVAAGQFLRRDRLIESVLVTAIVIDMAAALAGTQAVPPGSAGEIAPVLPFAAVLAARCLAPPCPARRFWLGVFLALYAGGLGYAAAQPPAAPAQAGLAAWLRAHHLTDGLGGYQQASIVTLETGGAVTLRPVTAGGNGRIAPGPWNTSAAWYGRGAPAATFLVLAEPGTPGASGLTAARAAATFGPPAARYRYQAYEILTWRPGTNLLAALGSPKEPFSPAAMAFVGF